MQRGVLFLVFGTLASLQANATPSAMAGDIYVVHGINGTDLGLDEELEVDVAVSQLGAGAAACLTDPAGPIGAPLAFGDVSDPIEGLSTAIRQVVLSLADIADPCGGEPAVAGLINTSAFDTALVVAHLDANGAPRVSGFTVDASELDENLGRLSAIHAAAAPAFDVEVLNKDTGESEVIFFDLENGGQTFPLQLEEGSYRIRVSLSDQTSSDTGRAIGRKSFDVVEGRVAVGVVVGSAANGTIEVVPVEVDTLDQGGEAASGSTNRQENRVRQNQSSTATETDGGTANAEAGNVNRTEQPASRQENRVTQNESSTATVTDGGTANAGASNVNVTEQN